MPGSSTAHTATVGLPDPVRKEHQKYPYGSRNWVKANNLRARIEGVFG
ncbi:MAG: hypothetical protein RL219_1099 [Actinomycetota bacterium]|jgi:hypothetical protein